MRLGLASLLAILVARALAHRVEARLQRAHEVGDRRGLLLGGLDDDLLAGGLLLDHLQDGLAVGVLVLGRLELAGQRLDQLLGDVDLALVGLDVLGGGDVVQAGGVDDLVGEEHRRHLEHVVVGQRPDRDEALLLADDDLGDRDAVGVAHRLQQQPVGLRAAGPGRQVVRVVVEDRVDLVEVDEVLDVDRLGLGRLDGVEFGGVDHHVAVRRDLIALDQILVGDLLPGGGVDALLRDPRARLGVELVEADRLAVDRAVQLDGHGDEPEADGAGPDRTGHEPASVPDGTRFAHAPQAFLRGEALPLGRGALLVEALGGLVAFVRALGDSSTILALKAFRSSGLREVTKPSGRVRRLPGLPACDSGSGSYG